MELIKFRDIVSKYILYYNIILFVSLIVLTLLGGFLIDEFIDLVKLIAPIHSLYLATSLKFTIKNKQDDTKKEISSLYISHLTLILLVYSLSIFFLIVLGAFNLIDYEALTNIIPWIEVIFGTYASMLILDLFNLEKE